MVNVRRDVQNVAGPACGLKTSISSFRVFLSADLFQISISVLILGVDNTQQVIFLRNEESIFLKRNEHCLMIYRTGLSDRAGEKKC